MPVVTAPSIPAARRNDIGLTFKSFIVRDAHVLALRELSPHYRVLAVEGDALRDLDWRAGDQIQIAVGAGSLVRRTYTPFAWDARQGRVDSVVFLHGDGPGCLWMLSAQVGEACRVFGPRPSLALGTLGPQAALFGDETCFSLALAWQALPGMQDLPCLFEVSDVAEARLVLDVLGVRNAVLVQRAADDSHLPTIESELLALATSGARFALAGKAGSIQHMKRALRRQGFESSRAVAKAYWAPGKRGLD